MTTNDPDQIRADIARTRGELSDDVDALTDKVSPGRIAERQTEKVKGAVSGVKDKVFGAADDARERASDMGGTVRDTAGSVADTARSAPQRAKEQAQGNPLAAGLVAFGLGLLAASLIPASRKEQDLVRQAKDSDALQQVTEGAKAVGKEMADDLREPAQQAAQEVKETAQAGAENVKDTAKAGAEEVRGQAQQARSDVTDQAKDARGQVQGG
ncbi:DUF3618 domain-containing protein [Georgenia sp. TF02-10]|uniref:DUF3618 domain-containing protein n=1 Tax=Georgenia sp. TF02-10 TaxID=2917725 RepID=UPI001FA752E3|nr:DUF3618 domain-containing protein [Georgenia sp. TF02-10]UNX54762.1 DUF3618 domain-containing protein [Georgenia sp. TF02-10]